MEREMKDLRSNYAFEMKLLHQTMVCYLVNLCLNYFSRLIMFISI